MRPAERREVARAIAMIKAGDRSGAVAVLRPLRAPPRPASVPPVDQLTLPMLDAVFECLTLGVTVCVGVCIARQAASDAQRTQQTSRGQGTAYPSCDSRRCQQGRAIREAFDPNASVTWKWEGPVRLVAKSRPNLSGQEAARHRLAAVGLLDDVPTVDGGHAEGVER